MSGKITLQQKQNYENLQNEVTRRAHLAAVQCNCGYRLPYLGYRHTCVYYSGSGWPFDINKRSDPEIFMKQYISQQMAQLAMQL